MILPIHSFSKYHIDAMVTDEGRVRREWQLTGIYGHLETLEEIKLGSCSNRQKGKEIMLVLCLEILMRFSVEMKNKVVERDLKDRCMTLEKL